MTKQEAGIAYKNIKNTWQTANSDLGKLEAELDRRYKNVKRGGDENSYSDVFQQRNEMLDKVHDLWMKLVDANKVLDAIKG